MRKDINLITFWTYCNDFLEILKIITSTVVLSVEIRVCTSSDMKTISSSTTRTVVQLVTPFSKNIYSFYFSVIQVCNWPKYYHKFSSAKSVPYKRLFPDAFLKTSLKGPVLRDFWSWLVSIMKRRISSPLSFLLHSFSISHLHV